MPSTIFDEKALLTGADLLDENSSEPTMRVRPDMRLPFRIDVLVLTNSTASPLTMTLGIYDAAVSGPDTVFALVTLPASAGQGSVPPFDVLAALAGPLAGGLTFSAGYGLHVNAPAVPGTGETIGMYYSGGTL